MNEHTNTAERSDDELLSAYLDGELPRAEADRLSERLAREPELAARLEALGAADRATRELYAKLDELPLPPRILDRLGGADAGRAARPDNVIPMPRRIISQFMQAPVAIAASVALAAGFFVDRALDNRPAVPGGLAALTAQTAVAGNSDMYRLLEQSRSAETVQLEGGASGRVRLTFEDTRGDWCRQLDIEHAESSVQALVCRRDGRWQTEMLAFGQPSAGAYQQAAPATSEAMDAAIDRLIGDAEPLDTAEEASLIDAHWDE